MKTLFASFDPMVYGAMMIWGILISSVMSVYPYWAGTGGGGVLSNLTKNFKENFYYPVSASKTMMFVSLFFLIFFLNFSGVFPYSFASTSSFALTMSLALPLWAGPVLVTLIINNKHTFSHFVPAGSPIQLSPFLVCVELVSNFIRPLALALRLAANITAGHVLLSLLSSAIQPSPLGLVVLTGLIALLVLEYAVATIQAYVFTSLAMNYSSEQDSPGLV